MTGRHWAKRLLGSAATAIVCIVSSDCRHRDQDAARAKEPSDVAAPVQAQLAVPDSARCARRNKIPLILERDRIGQYRVNQVSLDGAALKRWIEHEFRERPVEDRWLMVRDPSSFETQELGGIVRGVASTGGTAYRLDPGCVPQVPARSK